MMTLVLSVGAARAETVADLRAQLTTLDGQVQQLRDALVRQGAATGLPSEPASALVRLDQLEVELRRITDRLDVLTNDIDRVVKDASNRVGDFEFRLTELEGGDVSALGVPGELGGGLTATTPLARPSATRPKAELTVNEQSDFEAALSAAEAGEHQKASELFASFLGTYPGGPLSTEAQFRRGEAQAALSDWQGAARSFLDAFSGAPDGPMAPRSLYRLGVSLGELGQVGQACLTLNEVGVRYPGTDVAPEVASAREALNCT